MFQRCQRHRDIEAGMPSQLESAELADLSSQFPLRFGLPPSEVFSVQCAELLEHGACADYLDRLGKTLRSPTRKITASLFAKRYVFLHAVPVLYAMSAFNKGLEISLVNITIDQTAPEAGRWSPQLRISNWRVTEPATGRRDEWRHGIVGSLFAESIVPMWKVLSEVAHIPSAILWENTAVRLFSLYEKRLAQEDHVQIRERTEKDFAYVIAGAVGSLFGEKENPLTRFYVAAEKPMRFRQTCCFYYRVSADGSCCSICPKAKAAGQKRCD